MPFAWLHLCLRRVPNQGNKGKLEALVLQEAHRQIKTNNYNFLGQGLLCSLQPWESTARTWNTIFKTATKMGKRGWGKDKLKCYDTLPGFSFLFLEEAFACLL